MAVNGAEAVSAGVPAAEDDDALAGGRDALVLGDVVAGDDAVLRGQEVHRQVDAVELTPGDGQIARVGRATRQADGVEFVQ